MIYWFFGQPGAGKTTLAKEFIKELKLEKYLHIDGDNLRDITNNYDYTKEGRERNLQSVLDIARFGDANGYDIIISVVAPYNKHREDLAKTNNVILIYLYTNEIRGREDKHVDKFELPIGLYIDIDTTNKKISDSITNILQNLHIYGMD